MPRQRKKKSKSKSEERSWRTVLQTQSRKVVTPAAKKRRLKRFTKAVASIFCSALALGIVAVVMYCLSVKPQIGWRPPSNLIRQILFQTDGTLKRHWLREVVDIPKNRRILDVDIQQIKQRLEQEGQVRSATVERLFPNILKVSVQENVPILKVVVLDENKRRRQLLVAKDGTVYAGQGYSQATLKQLPYLHGVRLKRAAAENSKAFAPVAGMEVVAELLEKARARLPEFYTTWRLVSCKDFDGRREFPGAVIEIHSLIAGKVLFFPSDFDEQLNRLQYVLEYTEQNRMQNIEYVDLSLNGQAALKYAKTAAVEHSR